MNDYETRSNEMNDYEKASGSGSMAGSGPGFTVPPGSGPSERMRAQDVLNTARQMQNGCASENLKSRAFGKAKSAAQDAVRHERLAGMLTPEIEQTLFVLQECIALGLINVRFISDALQRAQREGRDRY